MNTEIKTNRLGELAPTAEQFTMTSDSPPPAQAKTPTPLTDAVTHAHTYEDGFHCVEPKPGGDWVPAAFARSLEVRLAEALAALHHLERASSIVNDRGATTGPQWGSLTIAILRARSALSPQTKQT